jgi:hypothetical protein
MEGRIVPTTVTISWVSDATEGGSAGAFRLTRDGSTGSGQPVSFTLNGTATPGSDFSFITLTQTIPAGFASLDVAVTPVNDSTSEPTETVIATIVSAGGATIGSPSSTTVNILDNDPQYVSVAAPYQAREDGAQGQFLFTRTGDLSSSLAVDYTVGGTATPSTDYTALSGTVMFAAGSATAGVAVVASHDDEYDPGETVTVTIDSGTGYTVGAEDEAEVTIDDDASNTFTLDSTDGEIWFDVDWDGVDPDEATDTADLTNVAVMFDGQLYTESNADFTVSPVANFEYGDLVSIEFTIAFNSAVAGFEALVVADGQVAGVDATTHQAGDPVNLEDTKPAFIILDFSEVYFSTGGPYDYTVRAAYAGGTESGPITVTIPQSGTTNATPQGVRDAMKTALIAKGLTADPDPDSTARLLISAPDGKQLQTLDIYVNLSPKPAGPKVHARNKGSAESVPEFSFRNE